METASSACTPQTRRNFTTVNHHLSSPKNQNTQFLHNFPKFTKSPQTGRNYTTRPPPSVKCFSSIHQIFTFSPQILQPNMCSVRIVTAMQLPYTGTCYRTGLYGAPRQNQPIRAHLTEPALYGCFFQNWQVRALHVKKLLYENFC